MEEQDFHKKCDAALVALRDRLLDLGDELGFDVEGQGEKLEVLFEEPEVTRFVISPNTPVRQIWVSAHSRSFKLDWNAAQDTFVLPDTGETLTQLIKTAIGQQLGKEITL